MNPTCASDCDHFHFQASARWEDGKLVIEYKPKVEGQGNAQKVTREIANGQLVMVSMVHHWYMAVIILRIAEYI